MNIFSLNDIRNFSPNKNTILIRIFDSDFNDSLTVHNNDLPYANNFKKIYQFVFDDVDLSQFHNENEFKNYCIDYELKPMTLETARDIVNIGNNFHLEKIQIAVHCKIGTSRSPAVLAALNYIFNLNLGNILKSYPKYNRYVNQLIISESKKIIKETHVN